MCAPPSVYAQDECPELVGIGLRAHKDWFRSVSRERLFSYAPRINVNGDVVGIPSSAAGALGTLAGLSATV
jgi:hypothetical protein